MIDFNFFKTDCKYIAFILIKKQLREIFFEKKEIIG
jgi:hypothetical protein